MDQLPLHGDISIISKRTKRVNSRVNDDAGKHASAAIKNSYKHKAYRNRKYNLAQIAYQAHAAAVEKVDNVPYAESYA